MRFGIRQRIRVLGGDVKHRGEMWETLLISFVALKDSDAVVVQHELVCWVCLSRRAKSFD